MPTDEVIRIGTRRSPLAQAQTDRVIALLGRGGAEKVIIESEGDLDATRPVHQMSRPGAFTSLLTDAILDGRIDAAVHSLKDLPLEAPLGAPIVAILARDDPADTLVRRDAARDDARPLGLRTGARVGTSAPRRHAQLLAADPELVPVDVRGNVGTRLRLVESGTVDALLMAVAAFERMPLPLPAGTSRSRLDPERFPPAPGQGTIAVQARADTAAAKALASLDDAETRAVVQLERALLARMGGGCGLALGAYARRAADGLRLDATFSVDDALDASTRPDLRRAQVTVSDADAQRAGLDAVVAALRRPSEPRATSRGGRTVALTLRPDACAAYEEAAGAAGWRIVSWPLLVAEATGRELPPRAEDAAWVCVTSPRGAPYAARALASKPGAAPRVAALGPSTARALRRERLPVHVVAADGTGAGLARAIASFPARPAPALLVEAEDALPDLSDGLAKAGFETVRWRCYRTRSAPEPPAFPEGADALVLTSPSNVDAFLAVRSRAPFPGNLRLLAFGATTEAAMRRAMLPVHKTLERPTPRALAEALS